MSERPNVTVVYQDAKPAPTEMGCLELTVSILMLAIMALIAGWRLW